MALDAPDAMVPADTGTGPTDADEGDGGLCITESSRSCYAGPMGTDGVGRCRAGVQVCSGARTWSECTGSVLPAAMESCGNGIDDDCNGMADDGCGECAPGATQSCYSGAAGTAGRGVCRAGTQVCGTDRRFGMCTGEVVPSAERCDGMDNDCDSMTDEAPDAPGACGLANATAVCRESACAVGACAGTFADCDRMASTGCEVDLASSALHCGGCGLACAPGQTCATGRCVGNTGLPIGIGAAHACAVQTDGSVVCWGYNVYGQLGDSTVITRTTPTPVPVLMDAAQVEAGANTTCARRASGALLCWGYNLYGQVGDNTRTQRPFPTAVLLLTSAQHVEEGDEFGCAVSTDGSVTCWGRGDSGQLGDGTLTSRNSANRAIFGLP